MARILLLLASISCSFVFAGDVDKVVVVVNDEAITQYDVNEFMQATLASIPDDKRDYAARDLKKQHISLMVDQALVLDVAKNKHIKATEEMVSNVLTRMQSSMKMDDDAFAHHLEEFNLTMTQFKAHIEKNITASLVQEAVVRDTIKISPKMVAHHIKADQQAKTQYIFNDYRISKGDLSAQQQKDHANRLYEGINSKTKIPDAIKGFVVRTPFVDVTKEAMPDVFYQKLANVKPKTVIGPFKLENGYHVIWYREKKMPEPMTENQAGNEILAQKAGGAIDKWMKNLHEAAYIQFFS